MDREPQTLLSKRASGGNSKESQTHINGPGHVKASVEEEQLKSDVGRFREAASGPLSSTWRLREIPQEMGTRGPLRHESWANQPNSFRRIEPNGPLESQQYRSISFLDETSAVVQAFGGTQCSSEQLGAGDEPSNAHIRREEALTSIAMPRVAGSTRTRDSFRRIEPKGWVEGSQKPWRALMPSARISFHDETRALKQAYGVAQDTTPFQDETRVTAEAYGNEQLPLPVPASAGSHGKLRRKQSAGLLVGRGRE
ncbi:hypothetical protein Purlil1_14283 [Purpureocillium lilacinum]|uniref:Uncharacterized protein n=1 Tax=Purpureocillium lilacinum TaxID=33203 RepID=A0ABR0BBP9_PURLI|nr:hypothetical protein Purlil1_14283 [Purpureocillium lilacinum]